MNVTYRKEMVCGLCGIVLVLIVVRVDVPTTCSPLVKVALSQEIGPILESLIIADSWKVVLLKLRAAVLSKLAIWIDVNISQSDRLME